jgi:phosphonopyruvate decarboxylase
MLDCREFIDGLLRRGVQLFTGVPDSLLKDFCACVTERLDPGQHVITANEGAAVALAAGHFLATGRPALVYMQNAGQGNAVNPWMSLTDTAVYGLPHLLLIGWRGEPGRPDEPQHVKQGEVTHALLDTLGISHAILPGDPVEADAALDRAFRHCISESAPYALVVRKGTFAPYKPGPRPPAASALSREEAVIAVAKRLSADAVVVSTTGKISRELYEYRDRAGVVGRDLYCVGSMGHASQIALGLALARPDRPVWCLDGDGAVLMHMGALAVIGQRCPSNFYHVTLNNGVHDSVGGQPTAGFTTDLAAVARACGYSRAIRVDTLVDLEKTLADLRTVPGPVFLEVRVAPGARADLGRPGRSPRENRDAFMRHLGSPIS